MPSLRRSSPMPHWLKLAAVVLTIAGASIALTGTSACHGHRLPARWAPNAGGDFDFAEPPCPPAGRPEPGADDLLVQYLGVGGVYIEWKGSAILTAPFSSRYGPLRAAFGSPEPDVSALKEDLKGTPLSKVRAILAGHSHYDHLGDLPALASDLLPGARIHVNESGEKMLGSYPALKSRIRVLKDGGEKWTWVEDADGLRLPIRFTVSRFDHADHFLGFHYAGGEVKEAWTGDWYGRKLHEMKEGAVFAFTIDLMSEDLSTIAFRIHYQDAAGVPPRISRDRPADLAILCMAGHWKARGYPEQVVSQLKAGHVMGIHYEDFFEPRNRKRRFVFGLTSGRAAEFFEKAVARVSAPAPVRGPEPCSCGPCAPEWSMPLPGDWIRFPAR